MITEVLEEHTIDPITFAKIRILPDYYYSMKLNKDIVISYSFEYSDVLDEYSLTADINIEKPIRYKHVFKNIDEVKALLLAALIQTKPVNLKNTEIFKMIKDELLYYYEIRELILVDIRTVCFEGLGVMIDSKTNEVIFFNKKLSFYKEVTVPQFMDKIAYKVSSDDVLNNKYYFYDKQRNRFFELLNNRIQVAENEAPFDLQKLNREIQYLNFPETKQYLFDHCVIDMKRETEKQEIINQFANIDLY